MPKQLLASHAIKLLCLIGFFLVDSQAVKAVFVGVLIASLVVDFIAYKRTVAAEEGRNTEVDDL